MTEDSGCGSILYGLTIELVMTENNGCGNVVYVGWTMSNE